MTTVCIVQARLGSSRLPGKCLKTLAGTPMIEHVLRRARAITGVDTVVLATSLADRDTPLAEYVERALRVQVYRGSEHDVLERFYWVADWMQADTILRVTGDCPFLAPDVATAVLTAYRETNPLGAQYMSNDTTASGYPDGTDVEVFSRTLLDRAYSDATLAADREHVTPWMRRMATTGMIQAPQDWSPHKLSVDREDDYVFAVALAAALPTTGADRYDLATTMRVVHAMTFGAGV